MSAYGEIRRAQNPQAAPLQPTTWFSTTNRGDSVKESRHQYQPRCISIYHLTLENARALPGLLEYLGTVFAQVIEEGMTYPQEGEMPQSTFEAYFFAADVFVGLIGSSPSTAAELDNSSTCAVLGHLVAGRDIHAERGERTWEECIAGYYYIKPNYPGRSSHICNAGFIVPPAQRKNGYGSLLAKSYVHYAPQLGYQASVFNLVYVNNAASVKLWENLGFTKAGRIPRAGRLRTADGKGEEYVDAWVIYKSFIEQ
ncbi:hypothetical protein CPC08DRAFT_629702 [Agrocybe pediades]|nr:hypothetical protein CPC08DRAFT_629702 [Agrocybe pediades]